MRLDEDDHWAYSLCIIEGYSRKILAGMATEYQDTSAVLQLLAAVLAEYGRPAGIVSDNGSVFTSDATRGCSRSWRLPWAISRRASPGRT